VPKDISKLYASVLLSGGKINCRVAGKRGNKRKYHADITPRERKHNHKKNAVYD